MVLPATLGSDLVAQINSRGPGYNGALYAISSARAWGRRGPAYPGGEVGVSFQNGLCNPGTMNLEWRAADNSPPGTQMDQDHPKFGFLVAREVDGRLVQISDWSYCKHAFLSLNDPGTCGTCQNTTAAEIMYVGCSDVYTNANNGNRTYLGPPEEINPWLGTWNHVGSFFDVGLPANGNPTDGIKGTINPGTDEVLNRVTIKEADIQGGVMSGMYFQIHVIHEGEPVANRGDNIMSRPFGLTWTGTQWSATTLGTPTHGSILTRWPGSTLTSGQNGNDDGRFFVAVKVTGPSAGFWRYEYVVHNVDNHRGGASFRLPLCGAARVQGIGFRDIDQNPLNDWTVVRSGNEIAWNAPANNPHNWNTLYNFWFECDVAPGAGAATIDEARPGPGALTVSVPTTVPTFQPAIYVAGGCGTPSCLLLPEELPTTGNPNFAIRAETDPLTPLIVLFSLPGINFPITPQCHILIDLFAYGDLGFTSTDPSGVVLMPTPVDPTWPDIIFQAATFIPNPPVLDLLGLSNGLTVRYNGTGCP
ncbi:MAG: hypothetical protein KF830_14085 [Planctomycetes bacterium]|nr:hypothetical protein [Planctomycetota bacterium]